MRVVSSVSGPASETRHKSGSRAEGASTFSTFESRRTDPLGTQKRPGYRKSDLATADHVRGFLRDHDNYGIDVSADEVGHDRGIDDAPTPCPNHAQLLIDDAVNHCRRPKFQQLGTKRIKTVMGELL